MHVGRIRRGEAMFFNRREQPTLVARCGNPVVLGPSRPQKGNPAANLPQEEAKSRELELGLSQLAEPAFEPALALEPSLPSTEVAVAAATTYGTPEAVAAGVASVASTGVADGSFLFTLGCFAPLAASLSTGGEHPAKSAPVPEPATLIVLAAGMGGMLHRRRRRS